MRAGASSVTIEQALPSRPSSPAKARSVSSFTGAPAMQQPTRDAHPHQEAHLAVAHGTEHASRPLRRGRLAAPLVAAPSQPRERSYSLSVALRELRASVLKATSPVHPPRPKLGITGDVQLRAGADGRGHGARRASPAVLV